MLTWLNLNMSWIVPSIIAFIAFIVTYLIYREKKRDERIDDFVNN